MYYTCSAKFWALISWSKKKHFLQLFRTVKFVVDVMSRVCSSFIGGSCQYLSDGRVKKEYPFILVQSGGRPYYSYYFKWEGADKFSEWPPNTQKQGLQDGPIPRKLATAAGFTLWLDAEKKYIYSICPYIGFVLHSQKVVYFYGINNLYFIQIKDIPLITRYILQTESKYSNTKISLVFNGYFSKDKIPLVTEFIFKLSHLYI